jgi:pimeloyl-ACP methyl ester carboxylesterase
MHQVTRRRAIQTVVGAMAPLAMAMKADAEQPVPAAPGPLAPYSPAILPAGIRSRFVDGINGLRMHVLEAGFEPKGRPAVVMLHGFPELAYSWRKVMPQVAAAGFHVIAPDLRGYGRTSGTDVAFDDDLAPFRTLNLVRDVVGLVSAFGYKAVAAVVGHDFGSPLAAWCTVVRPDVFRSLVMMSAPFGGPPALPFDTADAPAGASGSNPPADRIYEELAALKPPRKHYQRYYSTREANGNMWKAPQGVHAFLRAYYHMKSADWTANKPHTLAARTAAEWAKLPHYELKVYSEEYGRNGFQGGLQGYRIGSSGRFTPELQTFSGRTIDVPSMFVSGKSDWGVYQNPGAVERMEKSACTRMQGVHLIEGAGHWVQQEQPAEVSRLILQFLRSNG